MNGKNIRKTSIICIIITILTLFALVINYNDYNILKEEFEENQLSYNMLKDSCKMMLIDPDYSNVLSFMKNDYSSDMQSSINNAKKNELRCALVNIQVIYRGCLTTYEIIGFNTSDIGKVYFEFDTDYKIFPEVGKKYVDCVFDENDESPYASMFDDTIIDIIEVW